MTAQNARLRRCGAALLCLVCAAVMVRSAFVGLEIDEEYALSLGFRLVSGDRLFYSMWEPAPAFQPAVGGRCWRRLWL